MYGTPTQAELTEPGFYAYDLATRALVAIPAQPTVEQLETATGSPVYGLVLGTNNNPDLPADVAHPAWIDYAASESYFFATPSSWNESTIVTPSNPVEGEAYIAYSAQATNTPADRLGSTDSTDWQIVVHEPVTQDTRIIEAATNPVWLDAEQLLFIRSNGVYQYSVANDTIELVTAAFLDLDRRTELAVTAGGGGFMMTIPSLNSVAHFELPDEGQTKVSLNAIVSTENVQYTNPVYGTDGLLYATVARTPEVAQLEIRSLLSHQIVETIAVPFAANTEIGLIDWRTTLTPIAFSQ